MNYPHRYLPKNSNPLKVINFKNKKSQSILNKKISLRCFLSKIIMVNLSPRFRNQMSIFLRFSQFNMGDQSTFLQHLIKSSFNCIIKIKQFHLKSWIYLKVNKLGRYQNFQKNNHKFNNKKMNMNHKIKSKNQNLNLK